LTQQFRIVTPEQLKAGYVVFHPDLVGPSSIERHSWKVMFKREDGNYVVLEPVEAARPPGGGKSMTDPTIQTALSDAYEWEIARHLDRIRREDAGNFPLIQALEAALSFRTRLAATEWQRDTFRRLAKEATNGWACYATRDIEHKEISQLHREIDALMLVPDAP